MHSSFRSPLFIFSTLSLLLLGFPAFVDATPSNVPSVHISAAIHRPEAEMFGHEFDTNAPSGSTGSWTVSLDPESDDKSTVVYDCHGRMVAWIKVEKVTSIISLIYQFKISLSGSYGSYSFRDEEGDIYRLNHTAGTADDFGIGVKFYNSKLPRIVSIEHSA